WRCSATGQSAHTLIDLEDVKNVDDTFKFVQDRLSGAEHYQGTLVSLQNVSLQNAAGWENDGTVTIIQGALTLEIKLGLNGFDGLPPTGTFNVCGIFDQESYDYTSGYRLWVTDPGWITPVPEPGALAMMGTLLLSLLVWRHGGNRR
ncbi:MAG: hypothetical protein ACWGMZ_12135, partial [Thermoguttaceae bacterium]